MADWLSGGGNQAPQKKSKPSLFQQIKSAATSATPLGKWLGGHTPEPVRHGVKKGTNIVLAVADKPGQSVRNAYVDSKAAQTSGKSNANQVSSFFSGAGKGLLGKEHATPTEMVSSFATGKRDKIKKLPFGVDTAVGVVTDPTSYVGLGASSGAKAGVKQVTEQFGKETAQRIAQDGAKNVLTDVQRSQLKTTIRRNLVESGAAKSVQQADKRAVKIISEMDKSGRGGLKFAGKTVIPAESSIGRAAAAINPKRVIGEALQKTDRGLALKGMFVRHPEVANAVGADARKQLLSTIDHTGNRIAHLQDITDAAAQNVAKGVNMADPVVKDKVLSALDIASENAPLQAAKQGVTDSARVVKKGEKIVLSHDDKMQQTLAKQVEQQTKQEGTALIKRQVKEQEHAALLKAKDSAISKQEAQTVIALLHHQGEGSNFSRQVWEREKKKLVSLTEKRDITASKQADSLLKLDDKTAARAAERQAKGAAKLQEMTLQHKFLESLQKSAVDRNVSSQISVHANANTPSAIDALRAQGDNGVANVVDFSNQLRQRFTGAQQAAGVGKKAWDVLTPEYVPRYITTEGSKALKDKSAGVAVALGKPGKPLKQNVLDSILSSEGHVQARKLRPDLNIKQINELMINNGVMKHGQKFFDDNALSSMVRRSHAADAAVEHAKMLDELTKVLDKNGTPLIRTVDKSYAPQAGEDILDLTGTKGVKYVAHPEVKKVLDEASALTFNDASLKAFHQSALKATTIWRSLATIGPAFHARNAAGNFWLNWLAGVKDPKVYAEAASIQRKLGSVFKGLGVDANFESALKSSALTHREQRIVKDALDRGVIDRGFFHTDLPRPAITGEKEGLIKRSLSGVNKVNRKVGSAVENNARMAHYIDQLGKTGSAEQAAESVKKYLFDYGDLTATERHKFKAIMPFYTFMRKNTPLELEKLVTDPRKFSMYNHLNQDLNNHNMRLRPDLPFNAVQDLLNVATAPTVAGKAQAAAAPLNPALKTVQELATQHSTYNGYAFRNPREEGNSVLRTWFPPFAKVDSAKHTSASRYLFGLNNEPSQPKAKKKQTKGGWLK